MTTINEVLKKLDYLKLKNGYNYVLNKDLDDELLPNELKLMNEILEIEVNAKKENNKLYNVKAAAFLFVKTLNDFDFKFQPSITRDKIESILESDFYNEGTNVFFIGNTGVVKTHLAISIGYEIAIKRNSAYFIKLIYNLKTAYNEGTLEKN